jgi:asparagine synthase (glutamine-hydrolysing)
LFAVIARSTGSLVTDAIDEVAARLRGCRAAAIWKDSALRGAAAAATAGTLPQDVFDQQPLVSPDLVFVCRVRLDNRAELAAGLGMSKADEESSADSTLLRMAYLRWAEGCVHKIIGDFAFAAWHPQSAKLTAAVDHAGNARLYWARVPGGLALAGELAALLAHPDVSGAPDLVSLARMLDAGLDRSSTPFLAVRALTGGHWLRWTNGGIRIERWWNPETSPTTRLRDAGEYVDRARELLERAVRAQSRSSGAVASTLSGGLDSGLVTSILARQLAQSGATLTAYTSVPEPGMPTFPRRHWEPDDSPYVGEVTQSHANLRHERVHPAGRSSIALMPELFRTERVPMKSISNLIWMDAISRKAVASSAPVILTGAAGNATISWSGAGGVGELLRDRRFGDAVSHARLVVGADKRPLWRMLAGHAKHTFVRHRDWHRPANSLRFVRAKWRQSTTERQGAFARNGSARANWLAFVTTPKTVWSPDLMAQRGADWRDPTGDRRLTEALLTFPLAAFAQEGLPRGLARAVGRGLLPESVRLRRTRGAQVPELASLIARDAGRFAAACDAMSASPMCADFLDLGELRSSLGRIVAGEIDPIPAAAFERAFGVGHFLLHLDRSHE